MIILYLLVPLGLVLCGLAIWAFFWAVNTGQFESLDAAAVSPLEEEAAIRSQVPSSPGAQSTASPSSP